MKLNQLVFLIREGGLSQMRINTLMLPRLTERDGAVAGIGAVAGAAIVAPGLAAPVLAGMLVWMGTNAIGFLLDRVTAEVEGECHTPVAKTPSES